VQRVIGAGAHVLPSPALPVAAALAVVLLLALWSLGGRAVERWRRRYHAGVVLDIIPAEGASFEPAQWVGFFRNLYGIAAPWWKRIALGQPWITLEFWAEERRIVTRCWVPERLEPLVRVNLATVLAGAEIRNGGDQPAVGKVAVRSRLRLWRDPLYPLGQPKVDALRGVLSSLLASGSGVVQLAIAPDVRWQGRAQRSLVRAIRGDAGGHVLRGLLSDLAGLLVGGLTEAAAVFGPSSLHHPASHPPVAASLPSGPRPPADKAAEPGYRAEIRLAVASGSRAESRHWMQALTSAFRTLDGANALRPARVWRRAGFDRSVTERRPPGGGIVLTAPELAGLFHLPCPGVPMDSAATRILPAPGAQRRGRTICLAEDAERTPIVLTQADARHHAHVMGSTGSGKTTVLLNTALDVIEANDSALIVVDSKGDLIRDLEERIPDEHLGRVIVIDPAQGRHPVGLNLLECEDPELRELVCDSVVTIFRKNFDRYWGPRTDDVLRVVLLTLLRSGGATLLDVPLLLQQPEARIPYTALLDDPVGLGSFWSEYERMSEVQRAQLVGPLLNKVRAFLLPTNVRNMLGQVASTVDLGRAMDDRRIVLISLAKGQLGEEVSRLLGSLIVARIWQAAMARSRRPEPARADVNLFLEEFQDYLHLPSSIDDVLAQARGYRLSLTLTNQHLGQLSQAVREALAANARTRVVFQVGQEDARYLAREFEPWLGEQQLRNLQRHQVAIRLCVDGRTEPPVTGMTRPAPASLGEAHAERLIRRSAARYGRPHQIVAAEIHARLRASGFDVGGVPEPA
jgi:hypothetical protein